MEENRHVITVIILLCCCCSELSGQGSIKPPSTYHVVVPNRVRPNQDVVVAATVMRLELSDTFTVKAVVRHLIEGKQAEEICSAEYTFYRPATYNIRMKTPKTMAPGNYTIRVSGFSDPQLEGLIFTNETKLFINTKQISVFIQTNKPYYNQNQKVLMRIIPLHTNSKPVTAAMDISVMDPNNVTIRQWWSQHTNAGGVITLEFLLNNHFMAYGTWTIKVFCMEHYYYQDFVVREFYGPLFFVNVSMPSYMFSNSWGVSGILTSTQGTLKPVKGNATVQLHFLQWDGTPVPDKRPLTREIPWFDHRATFDFTREELLEAVGGGESGLIGKQLKATAKVTDWFFNTTAGGEASTKVFNDDVVVKFLGGEVWSFKPNIPFQIFIAAQMRDGSPMDPYLEYREIELMVSSREMDAESGTSFSELVTVPSSSVIDYWLYPTADTEQFTVTARFKGKLDTQRTLTANRYWSPDNHYLKLSTTTKNPAVGHYIIFNVQTNAFADIVYYYIVAAGNIIVSDSLQMYSRNKLFSVALSRDMSPSAKIVAFYISPNGQVSADSIQFNVDGTQLHEMSVKFNRGKDFTLDTVEITAKADPLSYVAFSALEYHMYDLGIRNGLSWPEVNQELYSFDDHANSSITHYFKNRGAVSSTYRAPAPSYAHDANSTFYYAGLYIFTDANVSAVYTNCNMSKGEYPCMDGLSCYTWNQMCDDVALCSRDKRDEMGCHLNETRDLDLISDDAWQRTKKIGAFYRDGAFLWKDMFTKADGRVDIKFKPPPYGVSWVISGFAMSRENGLAILPGLNLFDSGRPMYINVAADKRLRLGEIVALRVTIFNNWSDEMDILITIPASEKYKFVQVERSQASEAGKVDGEHQVIVPVFAGDCRQIYIPVEPVVTGDVAIPVRAMSFMAGHTVTHKLSVGFDGISDRNITNYQVDLRIADAEKLPDLYLPVEENYQIFESRFIHYIPDSPVSYVSVIGDIVGISFFPYAKYDLKTMTLIGQPYYSGAEAVFNFGVNVYTLDMLRSLGKISQEKIKTVAGRINIAMQEMYAHRRPDGSFHEFRWSDGPSTWVTAIGLRVMGDGLILQDLRNVFTMPQETINVTANWLITQQDQITGKFIEPHGSLTRLFESKVDITVNGITEPANLALTALCVISLSKASTATALSNNVILARQKATSYLERHYNQTSDPFELSIVTYALMLTSNTGINQRAFIKLLSMRRQVNGMYYWSDEKVDAIVQSTSTLDTIINLLPKSTYAACAYTVSATSYAMLSIMENGGSAASLNKQVDPIQRFLQEQHMWVGGFSSSQDTLVAVQALKALANKNQDRVSYDMTFTFTSDQVEDWVHTIHIDQSNWFELQRFKTPSHWGTLGASAKGHGIALVQMETTQNFDAQEMLSPPPIPDIFDLGVYNVNITTGGFNHSFIHYHICPRWNGPTERSGMAVLEIGIPTGYRLAVWAIQAYVKAVKATTSLRAGEQDVANGIAIFYFDYLDHTYDNCVKYTAYRWFPVANMAELTPIKVYEYYEPGNYFSGYYEKFELMKLTVCLVCGSYQCPYCPNYNSASVMLPNVYGLIFLYVLQRII